MAIEEGLKLVLSADAGELVSGINTANKSISILQAQFERLQKLASLPNLSFAQQERLNKMLTKSGAELEKFKKAAEVAGNSLNGVKKPAGDATQSLINLSRIAQDAPYGFIGIANNLNPMLESFQRLQKESGGAKSAFQAMVAGLTGPAGIGLALGVVSSLLVAFGGKIFGAGEETKSAADKFDYFTDQVNDAKDALSDFNTQVDQLAKLGDVNLDIAGLKKSLGLEAAVIDIDNKIQALKDARDNLNKIATDIDGKLNAGDKNGNLLITGDDRKELESKLKETEKALRDNNKEILKLQSDRIIAGREVVRQKKKEAEDEAKAAEEAEKKRIAQHKKDLDALRKRNKEIEDERHRHLASLTTANFDFKTPTDFFKDAKKEIDKSNPDFEKFVRQKFENMVIPVRTNVVSDDAADKAGKKGLKGANAFLQAMEDAKQLQKVVEGTLTPAFENLFSAITAGENPMKAFFESLGQSVQQLIAKLFAAAAEALILSFILPGGGGGFGSLFSKLSGIPKLAEGGIVNKPTLALIGEGREAEAVMPLSKLQRIIDARGGGGSPVYISGNLAVSGDQLRLLISRTDKRQGRIF